GGLPGRPCAASLAIPPLTPEYRDATRVAVQVAVPRRVVGLKFGEEGDPCSKPHSNFISTEARVTMRLNIRRVFSPLFQPALFIACAPAMMAQTSTVINGP